MNLLSLISSRLDTNYQIKTKVLSSQIQKISPTKHTLMVLQADLAVGGTTMYEIACKIFLFVGLCLDLEKRVEKITSHTVVHCSTFRLFIVNIVLS